MIETSVSLGHKVHEILAIPSGEADLLSALADTLCAQTDGEAQRMRAQLVVRLNAPLAPAQLSDAIIHNTRVISLHKYLRESSPPFGTYAQRQRIIQQLVMDAAVEGSPAESRRAAARAALLLAAQEGFVFGGAWLDHIVRSTAVTDLLAWPNEAMEYLRERLAEERLQSARLFCTFKDAVIVLQTLMDEPGTAIYAQQLAAFARHVELMLRDAAGRPDFQWRAANLLWMLVNVAGERQRLDVIAQLRDRAGRWQTIQPAQQLTTWIEEAFTTPWKAFATTGVQFVTSAQLQARHVRRAH